MVVTGKDCNQANEVLRRMDDALFDKARCIIRNGRRYASLRDIITLIMVLPGKMAKELRSQFAEIIENYIRENMTPGEGSSEQVGFKRKREQLELLEKEENIKGMAQTRILEAADRLERMRDPSARSNLDERTRLMLQDSLQNSILNTPFTSSKAISDGSSPNKPISIGSVAAQLGFKPTSDDAKRIGLDLRKRYIKQHGKPPPKHDQLCDGRVTQVNSYMEQDRSLVEDALQAYFKPDEEEEGAE